MSAIAMRWAVKQKIPAMPKMVLMMLSDHHNGETGECFPSHEVLAEECGMDKRSVIRQIEKLEKGGFLSVEREIKNGVKQRNKYKLNIINSDSVSLGVVTESHRGSDSVSLGVVTESHMNQEYINQEINLSSSPLSGLEKTETEILPEPENPIAEPEQTHAQKIILSVVQAQTHTMTEHEMKVLVWVVQEKQDLFWIGRLEKTPTRFGQYLAGSLGEQFREFEAKKIRAELSRNNAEGFNNSGTYANAGGNYATNSNIVPFGNKKLSTAERQLAAVQRAIEKERRDRAAQYQPIDADERIFY